MKQKILFLCVALFISVGRSYGGVTLTVPDVNITPGGTAYVMVNADFGTQSYTAYQFDIAYPEGISAEVDSDGNPLFAKGPRYVDDKHLVSSTFSPAGLSRFQCFSLTSDALTAKSGTLLTLTVKAKAGMAVGTYQATIAPIEFAQTDATPDRPGAVTFNIVVSRQVVLDENATLPPTAAKDVNVTVRRTINAGAWSTICLPFAMSATQCKAAFGNDVQIGDFKGYDYDKDADNLKVKFAGVIAMEANHPYIICVPTSLTQFSVDGVDISPIDDPVNAAVVRSKKQWSEMIGTYVAKTVVADNVLFISGSKFWYSTGNTEMKAYRAYFDFYDEIGNKENSSSRIMMTFDGITTVSAITAIETDDGCYTLGGRREETPAKGLYIKRGKKVIVK